MKLPDDARLDHLIPRNNREETDRSTKRIMGGGEPRGSGMYTVMKDGETIGYFEVVTILPNGVLACQTDRHGRSRDAYYAPGGWDVACQVADDVEIQWGVRISLPGHPEVVMMAKDKHDAGILQSANNGELVSRKCGPWEAKK